MEVAVSDRLRAFGIVFLGLILLSWAPGGPAVSAMTAQAGATIAGSVVDAALNPLAGVAVTLERGERVEARTTSGADGRFRFAAVSAGDYRVRAALTGFSAFSKDLRVPAGVASLQLPIVMARPGEKLRDTKAEDATSSSTSALAPPPSAARPPQGTAAAGGAAGGVGGRGGAAASGGTLRSGIIGGLPQSTINLQPVYRRPGYPPEPGETYTHIDPNRFQSTSERPLSTFGADVDTASYSNARRYLSSGQLPPREAVRIEELVNYFRFAYADPRDGRPIALTTEVGDCPWAPAHKLVLIGARAKAPVTREITGRNIVLLIDVSGSMQPAERLPLIKTALGMFVDTLRPDDTLSIVTYAGTSGIALYPTPARQRDVIQRAVSSLSAGGSTNGAQGLVMAYRVATEAFIPGGVNRVILATDGDFNVGITSEGDLLHLIERERESGVFLSVFGVGSGNLKDRTMEMLADRGNGHYAYLDSLQEARRVLIREGEATLDTVAKDVKFQVEFNPAAIAAWKLIGYEDRALAAEDFNNDRKDAGEMGAGHTVTVLYEVIPVGVGYSNEEGTAGRPAVDPLRYQPQPQPPVVSPAITAGDPVRGDAGRPGKEWLLVKARYKLPEGATSDLITQVVRPGGRLQHLPFAAAVAEFGLLLRDAPRDTYRWDALARRVAAIDVPASMVADKDAFKELIEIARGLARLR
jgi:Ca-activated chloride channel family protein